MSALGRRAFVKAGALALLGVGSVPPFLVRAARAATPSRRVKTLIVVFQRGAADGLSMVAPYGDASYYGARATIAIPRPGPGAEAAIDLDGFFGLHPACAPLLPVWQERRLAVVHACGSPHATRSHFDAQDYMETATPGVKSTPDGWLSRALVATRPPAPSSFRGVAIGPVLPRSLRGAAAALAFPAVSDFEVVREGPQATVGMRHDFEALYERSAAGALGAAGREAFEAMRALRAAEAERQAPANGAVYPRGRLGESLRQLAQLVKMGVGLEVGFVDVGGWDTHAAQGASTGQLASRLGHLAQGLAALDLDLGERMSDVVVLTMTEFGRTVRENGNRGTDHGHGTAMLALGGTVVGGRVLGRWPGLARDQLFEGRDLAVTTDFRHLFAGVADRHLGVPRVGAVFFGERQTVREIAPARS